MNFIESYHYLLLGISLLAIPGLINAKSLSEQIEELQKTSNYSSPFDVDTLITHHHPSQNGNSDGDAESSTVVYRDNVDNSDFSPNIAHSGSSSTTHYYPSSTSTSRPNSLDSMVKPNIDIDSSNPVNNGREDPLQKILPKVRFNCSGRPESYYADPDFNCEVFHYCKTNGFRFTFVCPPRSQFNQKHMTCDYDKPGDALCSKPSNESLTSTDNYSNQSPASIDSELITVLGSTERPFTPITPSASPTPSYSSPEWPNSGPSTVSSDKHDSSYGFEPLEHGQPYGHFPSLGSTDEEDFNRGNSHEVQETSKKTSFADPPSDIENSYKSSSKPNLDIVSVSTESIPDIAVSSGSPKSRIPMGYSSPMPDIEETSNKDSSGGFKPVFMDKGSGSGGPRKYSTVAPPILEIEAADNSGKVDLPSSMTTGSPFSVGPAYSTSLTPSYSPSTPVFSTSFSSPSTSSSSPSSSPPSASFSPSTTTPMPATSVTPIQQSTISSPPRSKYHSLDDGNDLKPLTKITVQPIDLNYLNSNRNLKPKATSNSQRTSQRQPPSTSSNTYFSRPITSKVKDDYNNNNKVTSNGKGNGNQNNLHNVKSRVNKPTKYSTYSLFNDIRSDSRNSLTNGKTSHHASKSSFEPILGLTQFGQYTPSYLENIDRGAYPLNFNRSRPSVLSGQSSASSVATAASTPAISSAFLESQAAKFAQIAKLNLEKSNSHRDPFAFDYTALSQTDLPIFHPVYDQFHPGGQRSTLATVNSQLQEKFVSEKEQLFKKLRQQYAQDQIRKQLHQSLTDHVQQQGQQHQSNTLTGHSGSGVANLFANSGKTLTNLGSAPVMSTAASTPLQQMTQSTSLIPSVTLEEEEAKYPDYFYGLPKLSALSQPSSMAPGKSTSIPKFDGNLLHSVANGPNTGSQFSTFNNPFVSESNDANKKQPIEPYRLPIGKRPANPVQATSSSSLVSSLQRLPWFNSKNSPVAPDNIATSASNNDQSVSFASLFDQAAASSATNAQTSRRIPFFSQITKFFSSASFPRPSNLFPQITAKSSANFPFSYDQLSSSPMNSPSGYSNLFSNGHNPGHNYGQFSRSPVNNDQSSFPGSMNINRQMINRRHFSPSWEESFASSSMLEPIVAPDRRSSNGPVTFESRGPKPYFSIELGKDGWSSSVPLNGHFHSSQKNEQAKYNSDAKHNLYYIQPTHVHDHQKRSSRRKRSLRLTKPEYRYSMPHSNPSYSLFLRLFNNIRPNSLTFLTNPNKLVFGGPGGGHNFASASTLGATYLSPRFAPSIPNFSQSPYLGTTLRPVFTRQYDTTGYGHLPFASVNSPAFSPFTSGTSLGLGPHHSHYGLNLDSPFSSSSLSYEEDLKHRLLAQPKFLQTYDRPNLKSSSGFYENTDFNPLSIDLNELNEYESPPIYEAYSKKNSKEYDSNKEYYYRPVSLTKGNSKRPPKREKVPGHLQHSSSIEPQHSSRHHSIDDTSYSDASHSSSSSPSVHMDDDAYYKGDPNPNSYENGPEGPAYMDKEREPEIYEDVGPSPTRDSGRGPEGNVDDRDRSHDGYVNNPHHQSSYDYHSDGKKYDHYTSIDHYPEDGYDEGSSSGSMVRGHHDASIDYGALVPPYAKDLPSDPDSKSMGGVNYSTISQVYRPSLQVHQHRIHHVTSSPAQEYPGSNYYTPNEQHYVKHETGGNYESMNGKESSPYQNGNNNHNDANTYSNGPSMNQPITNQNNNNNNFKLEVIEDDYENSPQLPVRSNKGATKVKAESQNNEEQSKNYGYSPQSNIKYPYDYENTKIFINHGGGDHGRPYIGEAAYNEYPDSGYGDSDYANGKNYYPEPEQVSTPTTNQNTNSNINNNNNNDNNNNKNNNANNSNDNKSSGNNDKERDKVGQKKISPYDKKYHYNKPTITKITKEMKTSTPTMTEKPSSGQAPSSSYHSPSSSKIHTSESTSTYPIATVTLRPTTSTALPSATARPQPTRTSGSAYSSAARNRNANMHHEEQQDNTEDSKTTERSVASKVSLFKKQRPEFTKLAYKYKPSAYQQSRREANKPGSSSPSPSSDSVASIPTPSTSTTTLKPDPRYTASSHYYHNSPISSMVSTKSSIASQLATSTTTYRPTTARNHYTTQSSPSPSSPSSESSSVPTSLGDLDLASYGVRIFKGASGGVGTTKRPSVSVKASYSTVSSSSLPPVSAWKERKRDEQVKKQEQFKKQLIEQQRIRVQQLHQEATKTDSSSSSLISSSSSSSSSLISSSESKPSISTLVSSSSSTSTLKPIPRYSVSSYHNNPVNSVITLSSSPPSQSPSTTQSSPKLTKSSKSLKSLKSIKLASTPGTTSTPSTSSTSSSSFSSTPTSVYQSTTSSRNNSNLNNHNHNINNSSNSNNNSLNHKNSNSNTNSGTNSR